MTKDGMAWPAALLVAGMMVFVATWAARAPGMRWAGSREPSASAPASAERGIGVVVSNGGKRVSLVPDGMSATMDRIPVRVGSRLSLEVLVWELDGRPVEGLALQPLEGTPCGFAVTKNGAEIGVGYMTSPRASHQHCLSSSGNRQSPMQATVRIGERPGMYTVMLALHDGHFVRMLLPASA